MLPKIHQTILHWCQFQGALDAWAPTNLSLWVPSLHLLPDFWLSRATRASTTGPLLGSTTGADVLHPPCCCGAREQRQHVPATRRHVHMPLGTLRLGP